VKRRNAFWLIYINVSRHLLLPTSEYHFQALPWRLTLQVPLRLRYQTTRNHVIGTVILHSSPGEIKIVKSTVPPSLYVWFICVCVCVRERERKRERERGSLLRGSTLLFCDRQSPLLSFGLCFSFLTLYRQSLGLFGPVSRPLPTHRKTQTQKNIHASSEIRTH
jgi:hypothetical protein